MPETMTGAEARVIERRLVAWCMECEIWAEPSRIGRWCQAIIYGHDTRSGERRLVKRWLWICGTCDGSWWNGDDAQKHTCWEERG